MADPNAKAKERNTLATAAALAAVYASARRDVLTRLRGFGATLRPKWRGEVRDTVSTHMIRTWRDVYGSTPDGIRDRWDKYAETFSENWAQDVEARLIAFDEDIYAEVAAEMQKVVEEADHDAEQIVQTAANAAAVEAAKQYGRSTKTWHDPGTNNRPQHQALDGETQPIDQVFTNGMPYPHAPAPPSETVNCNCYLTFS